MLEAMNDFNQSVQEETANENKKYANLLL